MFVTVEGIEGSGKGLLIKGLIEELIKKDIGFISTREPGGTTLGGHLRTLLLDASFSKNVSPITEMLLYAADRSQHLESVIRPALEEGKFVISDRYIDSTYAYQCGGRGHDFDTLKTLFEIVCGGTPLYPQITLLLDLPVEIGLGRARNRNLKENKDISEGKFEALDLSFHERVRQKYLDIANKSYFGSNRYRILDATKAPDEVLKAAIEVLDLKK